MIRSRRRSSAILKISPSAVSISCSREFSSRTGKAFTMASFLFSRAQMMKGKPEFFPVALVEIAKALYLIGRKIGEAGAF